MSLVVSCQNLIKTYGEEESLVVALRGVDLEVRTGELLMLVGPSGCGKTTLLSVMTGILHQDSGECEVFGENLKAMNEEEKAAFRKKNVGFVFQALHLIPTLNALENAALPLLMNGNSEEKAFAKAKEMLERVGLGHRLYSLPSHMSGGEQQRVAICRGCIHDPGLIVCDEPTSTLDHDTGLKVVELFREIAVDEGKALVLVTHDSRIYGFADRILKMDDGRIAGPIETRSGP